LQGPIDRFPDIIQPQKTSDPHDQQHQQISHGLIGVLLAQQGAVVNGQVEEGGNDR